MSRAKAPNGDFSRYSVSLSSTNRSNSVLLGTKKGKRLASDIFKRFVAFIALLMIAAVALTGTLASAPGAKADIFSDAINDTFCSSTPYGYNVSDKGIQSATTKPKTGKALGEGVVTPYEKYGMYGTSWSTWSGFEVDPDNALTKDKGKGTGSSKGIVSTVGGNANDAGLDKWEKAFKKKQPRGLMNSNGECSSFSLRIFPASFGNILLDTAKTVTWISGFAYQASADASSNIYDGMREPVQIIVQKMKTSLYFEYLIPMIMVGALWLAWTGIVKRRTTEFMSGLAWSVGAIVVSVIFLTKPMLIPDKVNEVVSEISQGGMATITSYTSSDKTDDNMCTIAPSKSGTAKQKREENSQRTIRQIQCNLWYAFVYTPWTVGQFGASPQSLTASEGRAGNNNGFLARTSNNGSKAFAYDDTQGFQLPVLTKNDKSALMLERVTMGGKQAPTKEQNWALYLLDHKVNWDEATEDQKLWKSREQLHVAAAQLSDSNFNADYRGDNGQSMLAMGAMAALSAIGAGIMIVVISVSIIILDLGVIILALVSPIFFLAALHPGAGRRMAMGWVEMILKMALKRIALSIFLAIMIAIFGVMIETTKSMNWAISMILIVAVAISGLTYQKQISEMFNGFSLGGQQLNNNGIPGMNNLNRQGRRAGRAMGQNALGLVSGGRLGGHSSVSRMMRDRNEKKEWDERLGGKGNDANGGGAGPSPLSRKQEQQNDAARAVLQQQGYLPSNDDQQENGGGVGATPMRHEDDDTNQRNFELEQDNDGEELQDQRVAGSGPMPNAFVEENQHEALDTSGAGPAPRRSFQDAAKDLPQAQSRAALKAAALGGALAAGTKVRSAVAEKRKATQEKRSATAFQKQRHSMINEAWAKNGRAYVPTNAAVQSALDEKNSKSVVRKQKMSNGISSVKRASTNIRSKTDAAILAPGREFRNMVSAFNEDTGNRYNVAAKVTPRIEANRYQRREGKAFNQLVQHELKTTAKTERATQRLEHRERQADLKAIPKGVMRNVYAAEKYGTDAKGNSLPVAQGKKPVARTTAPQQASRPSSNRSAAQAQPRIAQAPAAQQPRATQAPRVTQAPAAQQPRATQAPRVAQAPAAQQPRATQAPRVAQAPAAQQPRATQAPAAQAPRVAQAPAAQQPRATQAPRVAQAPAAQQPRATQAPRVTQAPAAQQPRATQAPAAQAPRVAQAPAPKATQTQRVAPVSKVPQEAPSAPSKPSNGMRAPQSGSKPVPAPRSVAPATTENAKPKEQPTKPTPPRRQLPPRG